MTLSSDRLSRRLLWLPVIKALAARQAPRQAPVLLAVGVLASLTSRHKEQHRLPPVLKSKTAERLF